MAWVLNQLGKIYRDTGRYREAKKLIGQSLVTYIKEYGEDHLRTGFILRDLGDLFLLTKNLKSAENYFHQALMIMRAYKPAESYIDLQKLSDVYSEKCNKALTEGDQVLEQVCKDHSIEYLENSLSIIELYLPPNSPYRLGIMNKLKKLK